MPRENLPVQRVTRDGIVPSLVAANLDGHSITNDGRVFLYAKNTDTVAHTVTVVTPGQVHGLNVADLAVSIPAGGERMLGTFPVGAFGRTTDINYDAVTGVTIGALRA